MNFSAPHATNSSSAGPVPGQDTTGDATEDTGGRARLVRSLFIEVGLPVVGYYGARLVGLGDYAALLVATVLSGARLAWVALRDRKLDPFALFMLVLFGAGLALTFVTGDARLLLVKDVATGALAGLLFLGSALIGRPLTFYAAIRFAGAAHADRIRAGWAHPLARRAFTRMTVVWGLGLLVDAAVRIAVIYLLPIDVAVGVSTVLMVITFGALIAWTGPATRRLRAQLAHTTGAPTVAE
ncbi:MAG TPA: VC0807 family protein [Pseudonocardia sp.]|jgi:hypothetical protein|nr:VC0807 family protein [Pseudonocardia sp.]